MGEKEEMNFYDYSELLEKNSEGIEPNNIEEKPKDTKANFFKRKKPEELELSDLIELLKIEVETDNEETKPHMYEVIRLLETDEKYFGILPELMWLTLYNMQVITNKMT